MYIKEYFFLIMKKKLKSFGDIRGSSVLQIIMFVLYFSIYFKHEIKFDL